MQYAPAIYLLPGASPPGSAPPGKGGIVVVWVGRFGAGALGVVGKAAPGVGSTGAIGIGASVGKFAAGPFL